MKKEMKSWINAEIVGIYWQFNAEDIASNKFWSLSLKSEFSVNISNIQTDKKW